MIVRLKADDIGFGLSLGGGASEHNNYPLVISSIEPGGPAARCVWVCVGVGVWVWVCGCVCVGVGVCGCVGGGGRNGKSFGKKG